MSARLHHSRHRAAFPLALENRRDKDVKLVQHSMPILPASGRYGKGEVQFGILAALI
jgi:hypothetical protein